MNPHAGAFAGAVVALRRKVAPTTLLALLAGCAVPTADLQRPSSAALTKVGRTALAGIAAAADAAEVVHADARLQVQSWCSRGKRSRNLRRTGCTCVQSGLAKEST